MSGHISSASKSGDVLNRRFYGMSSMSGYHEISKLGQGTFGEVVKARNLKDKKLVALKSIIVHNNKGGFPITLLREVNIMKSLKDKNVLQLIELVCKKSNDLKTIKRTPTFYMVMPYMPYDLAGLLTNPRVVFTHSQIKCLMKQLLQGINYIHQQHYFHRDIKAANILIDHNGVLKIADFGLARNYEGSSPKRGQGPCSSTRRYTGLVVTRWYRAPELLLGDQRYTTAIDMWGVGCVFAEMFEKKPILQGKSDLDQGRIIFELVGYPTQETWAGFDQLQHANQFIFPGSKRSLEKRFARMGPEGISLLDGLLKLDPRARLNALDALDHPYFNTAPYPCRPEDLPKFEESHEMDSDKFKEETSNKNLQRIQEPWGTGRNQPPMRLTLGDTRYPQIASSSQRYNNNGHINVNQRHPLPPQRMPAGTKGSHHSYNHHSSTLPPPPRAPGYSPANKRRKQETDFYEPSYRYPNEKAGGSHDSERGDVEMKIDYSDDSLAMDLRRAAKGNNNDNRPRGSASTSGPPSRQR